MAGRPCFHSLADWAFQGNYTEYENIVGEPLRAAQSVGVPAPTLTVLYGILRAIQWRTKEQKGLVTLESALAELA